MLGIDPLTVTWTIPTRLSVSVDRLHADGLSFSDEGTGLSQCSLGENVAVSLTTAAGGHRIVRGADLTDLLLDDVLSLTRLAPALAAAPDPVQPRAESDPHLRAVDTPEGVPALALHPSAGLPVAPPRLVAVPALDDHGTVETSGPVPVLIAEVPDDATILKSTAATGVLGSPEPAPGPEDAGSNVPEDGTILSASGAALAALDVAGALPTPGAEAWDDATTVRELSSPTYAAALAADPDPGNARGAQEPEDATALRSASVDLAAPIALDDATIISTSAERAALSALAAAHAGQDGSPWPAPVEDHAPLASAVPATTYRVGATDDQPTVHVEGPVETSAPVAYAAPVPSEAYAGVAYPPAPVVPGPGFPGYAGPAAPWSPPPGPEAPTVTIGDARGVLTYALGDTLYVGREPMAPSDAPDGARALAVVDSPSGSVSATHLRLRHLGDQVLAWDMWSTNGTTVVPPTAQPFRLGSGEELAVVPGTLLDLGDGVRISVGGLRVP